MSTRESYLQASFQSCHDEGIQADHTHKFADVIHTQGWGGQTMTASYTVMSQKGLVCSNRLTYTKGMEELHQLLNDLRECRQMGNAGPLKMFSSDCLNIDGSSWKRVFPELKEHVVPYKHLDNNLPVLGLDPSAFVYLDSINQMTNTAQAIMNDYPTVEQKRIVYGLDTECCWGENDVRLMQVSFPPLNNVEQKVYLFDFNAAKVTNQNFPMAVRQMLLRDNFVPTGRAIGTDVSRLRDTMGVNIKCWIELRSLALTVLPTLTATGLQDLVRVVLKANLDKEGQYGDYSRVPLPLDLKIYAALDAYVSRRIYEILSSKLPAHSDVIYKGPDVCHLDEIQEADLFLGGRTVAKCTVTYVGRKGTLETRKWGKTTIAPGKVLVRIDEVWQRNVHPPLSYISNDNSEKASWKKEDVLLADFVGKEILVNISQLLVNVQGFVGSLSDDFLLRRQLRSDITEGTTRNEQTEDCMQSQERELSQREDTEAVDPFLVLCDNVSTSYYEDDENYRSRQKEDIFHQFKTLLDLISKKDPLRNTLSRLLIHATFIFHDEDFMKIETYLQGKMNFNINDSDYLKKITDHFYFNREWWRERCRMYIAKAEHHAARLRRVVEAAKCDQELSKLFTADVQEYFENFITKALRGEFEEQNDVVLFIKRGEDSHGLSLYYRLRGTVRTENLHQKMKMAIGPWNVGPKTAHTMLVLVCYRYNVQTKIRRCGCIDFGHSELHYIDRIQNRVQEIFNILAWPRHINQSFFHGKRDMVSVGIGPLTYDPKYVVQASEPDAVLKGDRYFMAKQMQLKYPILHIGSVAEIKIYNEFMKDHSLTPANLKRLAEIYKDSANGKDIFYKLPNMLKTYSKTWAKNSEIKAKEKALIPGINTLLEDLFCTRMSEEVSRVPPTAVAAENVEPEATIPAETNNDIDFETSTEMFVCPINVSDHTPYIPMDVSITAVAVHEKRCAWFPACAMTQKNCGGSRRDRCQYFKHKKDDKEFIARNDTEKKLYDRERKRLIMRDQRKRKRNNTQS